MRSHGDAGSVGVHVVDLDVERGDVEIALVGQDLQVARAGGEAELEDVPHIVLGVKKLEMR